MIELRSIHSYREWIFAWIKKYRHEKAQTGKHPGSIRNRPRLHGHELRLRSRQHERAIIPTIEELGIGLVAYSPLGKGFLTGKIDEKTEFAEGDIRNILPRYTEEARAANRALLDVIERFAESKAATPAQIALAWVLAQKPWIVPIPGTTNAHRLTENIGAASLEFSDMELEELEAASAQVQVIGNRYTEQMEKMTGR